MAVGLLRHYFPGELICAHGSSTLAGIHSLMYFRLVILEVAAWFFAMLEVTPPGVTGMTLMPNGSLHCEALGDGWSAALAAQYSTGLFCRTKS